MIVSSGILCNVIHANKLAFLVLDLRVADGSPPGDGTP